MLLIRLKSIWRNEQGVSAMEFAMLIPFLLLLFAGSIEVTFKIWATQKTEKLAVTLADVIAQSQTVTLDDLDSLTSVVDRVMDPFNFSGTGVVIISSVHVKEGETDAKVNWQYIRDDRPAPDTEAGEPPLYSADSKIGEVNADAIMPEDFDLAMRDNVIVAEVFYEYTPILPGLLWGQGALIPTLLGDEPDPDETDDIADVTYRQAFFKPRLGALIDPPE